MEASDAKPTLARILVAAILLVYLRRRELLKALAATMLGYLAVYVLAMIDMKPLFRIISLVLEPALYAVLAVTTHRIILLGSESVPEWGLNRWTQRETRFFWRLIVMGLFMSLTLFITVFFDNVGFTLIVIAIDLYVISRLSLVFPAIALEHSTSFKESWSMTRQHQWLMAGAVLGFPVSAAVLYYFIAQIPELHWLDFLLNLMVTVITVAALSLAYYEISRWQQAHHDNTSNQDEYEDK